MEVGLSSLSWPAAGPETIRLRARKLGSGAITFTAALVQGSRVIGTRSIDLSSDFSLIEIALTDAEVSSITDYRSLDLRFVAGNLPIGPCSVCPPVSQAIFIEFSGTPGGEGDGVFPAVWNGVDAWVFDFGSGSSRVTCGEGGGMQTFQVFEGGYCPIGGPSSSGGSPAVYGIPPSCENNGIDLSNGTMRVFFRCE
jgi:hypothetical protein